MKKRAYILASVIALVAVAGATVVAYRMGVSQSVEELSDLQNEVKRLQDGERDAAIVKRVSQQMEDIAYQQKSISDEQRDRAEQQSILATENAARAEMESRAAREAEVKANAAAQEAEHERANAERQQEIAVEQRDQATRAKNVADTLNIRTQARILGVTSQVRREAGETEVADLLAYTSWYFLKNYRGNQYFSDTFKALAQGANGISRYKFRQNSAVNAIAEVPGKPLQCVVATNYGEVEWLTATGNGSTGRISAKSLFFQKDYDFRAVLADKQHIYALAHGGTLCVLDYAGKVQPVPLPPDAYFGIIKVDGKLLLAGRKSLSWFTAGHVSAPIALPKTLSTLVEREGKVCLFFADGSYAEMDAAGKMENKAPLLKQAVVSAHYDKATECLALSVKDGTVYPLNKYNRVIETLTAHKAKCLSIAMQGSTIVTGGHDKMVYLWHMDNMAFESGMNFRQEMQTKTAVKNTTRHQSEIMTEWLVPVDYSYDGWTLAVCGDVDGTHVWIGTSNGSVVLMNVSADDMAQQLHRRMKRNFTEQEWTRYVGASIPYMKLK